MEISRYQIPEIRYQLDRIVDADILTCRPEPHTSPAVQGLEEEMVDGHESNIKRDARPDIDCDKSNIPALQRLMRYSTISTLPRLQAMNRGEQPSLRKMSMII